MAVFIDHSNNEIYLGHLKASGTAYPGDMVYADDSAGTATVPKTTDVAGGFDLYLVANYDSYADTDMTDSEDFYVADGEYLRLKALSAGEEITTDRFIGTYASISVDDIFTINSSTADGTQGKWVAIAALDPVVRAKVVEKSAIYGNDALKLRVLRA